MQPFARQDNARTGTITRTAWVYIGVVLTISWGIGFSAFVFGSFGVFSLSYVILGGGYMLIPGAIALAFRWWEDEQSRSLGFSIFFSWGLVVAWCLPVVLCLVALLLSVALPDTSLVADSSTLLSNIEERLGMSLPPGANAEKISSLPSTSILIGLIAIQAFIAGATINAVFALGEELGWRGFLQRRLQTLGFWHASAVVGSVWGIWHLPLIVNGHNYPDHPVAGVAMMVLLCVLLSPLLAHVQQESGTVLAPAIFHGTFNAVALSYLLLIDGGSNLVVGPIGMIGMGVLAGANVGLWFYRRVAKTLQ